MIKPVFITIIFFFLNYNFLYAKVPIIYISPTKSSISKSIVGSDISLLDTDIVNQSGNVFVGDVFKEEIPGLYFSRSGGYGTNAIIQTRGLPKRYTNVYFNDVKLSDPSTPDNSYYFNNFTNSPIKSIEVLRGNQSSVYGSGAIGGAVNMYSKSGLDQDNKYINLETSSNNTRNISLNYGKKINKHDFFISTDFLLTKGISAMVDNSEKDNYKNKDFFLNYGYQIADNLKLLFFSKVSNSKLNFDEVQSGRLDNNKSNRNQKIISFKIKRDNGLFQDHLMASNSSITRKVNNYNNTVKDSYYGQISSVNYQGTYNFNLDSKIIFGFENEFLRANYNTWATTGNKVSDDTIYSQFLDFNTKLNQKTFATIGFRNDTHSTSGSYNTGRATLAYKLNNLEKIRASFGTGIRFGSLNDYYYDNNVNAKEDLKPEESYSIDIGYDINFFDTNFSTTFFYHEYNNNISNWAGNTDGGRSSYVIQNSGGKIKSKGIDIKFKKKIAQKINFSFNHSYVLAYDGEDCDDPATSNCALSTYPVRVPKNAFNFSITRTDKNLSNKIIFNYISKRRDYGNVNNQFEDVILKEYSTINLKNSLKLFGKNYYFNIDNVFDIKYEDAYQYSPIGRKFVFGIKSNI